MVASANSIATRSDLYKYAAFFVLYEVSTYLANDMIMPGMIHVVREFDVAVSYAATSLSLFILGGCSLPFLLSLLSAKLGHRKVLLCGNAFFVLVTILLPLSQNINQFLVARFLQGMGLGFIFIGYATVHSLFDDIAAIKLTALLGNISLMAPLIGPLLGGLITNHYDWRWVFIVVALLSSGAYCGLRRYMPQFIADSEAQVTRRLILQYRDLMTSRVFLTGTCINSLNGIVTISWIGLSPVIILDHYQESFADYASYQLLVFSGTLISSIFLQFISHSQALARLVKFGSNLACFGLIWCLIFSFFNHIVSVAGVMLFTLGAGLYTGIINRLVISHWYNYSSPITALNSIIYALVSVGGLEACNFMCGVLGYSLPAWAVVNTLLISLVKSLSNYFIKIKMGKNYV